MRARPVPRRARPPALAAAAAFEAAPEAVALCRGDGRVVALNAAARRAFGRAAAGRLRLSDLVGRAGSAPLSALAGRPATAGRGRDAQGAPSPLEFSVRRLSAGRPARFAAYLGVGSGRGGTRRPPAPAEVLLGTLAHELNNPLAILLAQATVLRETAPDADVARRAERIAGAAQRAGRVLADLLAAARAPEPRAAPRRAGEPPAPARALSVLVVDDEADVAASLAELLALGGHAVTVETSPAAALDRAARGRFDAVFADLHMPGLDGLALRDALARLDPGLAGRTVIVTGDALAGGGEPGPDRAGLRLPKPFTLAAIRAVLDRMGAP